MMEKISRRGGARPGAGRRPEDLKVVTFYLAPETSDRITALSKNMGISKGKVVDRIVRWYLESEERQLPDK